MRHPTKDARSHHRRVLGPHGQPGLQVDAPDAGAAHPSGQGRAASFHPRASQPLSRFIFAELWLHTVVCDTWWLSRSYQEAIFLVHLASASSGRDVSVDSASTLSPFWLKPLGKRRNAPEPHRRILRAMGHDPVVSVLAGASSVALQAIVEMYGGPILAWRDGFLKLQPQLSSNTVRNMTRLNLAYAAV